MPMAIARARLGLLAAVVAAGGTIGGRGEVTPGALALHHPHDVVTDVALAPNFATSGTVFVSSSGSMNLFLVSDNGGYSWQNRRAGLRGGTTWKFVPASDWRRSSTGYAVVGGAGLQRTRDAGATWESPLSDEYLTELALAPVGADGAQTLFCAGRAALWRSDSGGESMRRLSLAGKGEVTCIAVSAGFAADGVVVVGTSDARVHYSSDGGETWRVRLLAGVPQDIAVAKGWRANHHVWVATHGAGVLRSTSSGFHYAPVTGIDDSDVNAVAVAATYPRCTELFAATRDAGVFRSPDGGESWTQTGLAVAKTHQTDNHYTSVVLSPQYQSDATVFCGTFEGLFFSRDGGEHWTEANLNPTRIGRAVEVSPRFVQDGVVFATTYGTSLLVSEDRGESWQVRTSNFDGLSTYCVRPSPEFGADQMVMCGVAWGIRRSTDGGRSWTTIDLQPHSAESAYRPYEVRDIAYSPDFVSDRTVVAVSAGGIYQSEDAGMTWTGRPPVTDWQRSLALSPAWTTDRTLFVGGGTLSRSTDGGRTWSGPLLDGSGFEEGWTKILQVACAPDFAESGEVYTIARHGGFLYSTDRGETWRSATGLDGHAPSTMRISPSFGADGTICLSTLAGGFFVSFDRGRTFARLLAPGSPIDSSFSFAVSPGFAQDETMFAATFDGIYRSTDRGTSWTLVTRIEFYDDVRDPWISRGDWGMRPTARHFNYGVHVSRQAGAERTLPFTGTGVRLFGVRGPDHGLAEVRVDGRTVAEIDAYAESEELQALLFEAADLEYGYHDLTIRVSGAKRDVASDCWISLDAAEIDYARPPSGAWGKTQVFADAERIRAPVAPASADMPMPAGLRAVGEVRDAAASADRGAWVGWLAGLGAVGLLIAYWLGGRRARASSA